MTPLKSYDYKGHRIETFIEDATSQGRSMFGYNIFKAGEYEDIIYEDTNFFTTAGTVYSAKEYVDSITVAVEDRYVGG